MFIYGVYLIIPQSCHCAVVIASTNHPDVFKGDNAGLCDKDICVGLEHYIKDDT